MAAGFERIRAIALANLRASPAKSAFLGVAFVVLVAVLVRHFAGGPKAASAVDNLAVAWNALTADEAEDPAPKTVVRRPRPRLAGAVARDPFTAEWLTRPAEVGRDAATETGLRDGELVLQCTMRDAGSESRLAVISGVVVYAGSTIEGYAVTKIGLRHVVLQRGTEERVLRLP